MDADQKIALARFSDVAVREKEFSDAELRSGKYEKLNGFAYLNAIFFDRHRRLLVKPVLLRLKVIAVLFCAALAASFFVPEQLGKLAMRRMSFLPLFYYVFRIDRANAVCRAMFYNCDISLLRYAFYRQRMPCFPNFKVRLYVSRG